MNVRWVERGRATVRCPLCATTTARPLIARVQVGWQRRRIGLVRCPDCGTVVPTAVLPPADAYEGEYWDWDYYVEQAAGIEVIAQTLALVDAPRGSTFLDVGCGFGFGLDLAVNLRGWRGMGLDPSEGARRGAAALGLDIRQDLLDPGFEPGARFDVILCSEVVEHLRDPLPVLTEIRARLAHGGVAVLTVPDAAVIDPGQPLTVVEPAISIGHHEFVPDADGFRRLLDEAGLVAEVRSRGTNLVAIAAADPAALDRSRPDEPVPLAELADYCGRRSADAPDDSPLAVGMTLRQVKFLAYDGRIPDAAACIPRLTTVLSARYGIDLADADSLLTVTEPPAALVGAAYFAGLIACIVDEQPLRGVTLFRAAARSADLHHRSFGRYFDPEVARFAMESLGELAALLAPTDRNGARVALRDLDRVARRAGDRSFADRYHARVDPVLA